MSAQKPTPAQLLDPKSLAKGSAPSFDPAKLDSNIPPDLNGAASPSSTPQFVFTTAHSVSSDDASENESSGPGMSRLIADMHGASERTEPAAKRIKLNGADKSMSSFGGSGGGELSAFIKSKENDPLSAASQDETQATDTQSPQPTAEPEVAAASTQTQHDIVDLTADDEPVAAADLEVVCLGVLDHAHVNCDKVPTPKNPKSFFGRSHWPQIACSLQLTPGRDNLILVQDAHHKLCGRLDMRSARAIRPLMTHSDFNLRTECRLRARKKRHPYEAAGEPCSDFLGADITLYAPRQFAEAITNHLHQKLVRLKIPLSKQNTVYYNPVEEKRKAKEAAKRGTSSGGAVRPRTDEEVTKDLEEVVSATTQPKDLPQEDPDARVTTKLEVHQKQALFFMKEHEDGFGDDTSAPILKNSLWKTDFRANGRKLWQNVVSGHELTSSPQPCLGGILADEMGLGKTLSLLSLVVSTMQASSDWSKAKLLDADSPEKRIRATLIICPLSVVSNWEDQIKTHLKPGSLSTLVYHGPKRVDEAKSFSKVDVIISTYQIVATEVIGRAGRGGNVSPLLQHAFFRVVLDEAHNIRGRNTNISRAACSLKASRRWAMTGTPVQNSIDDLASLLRFLRLQPFDDSAIFNHYLKSAFKNEDATAVRKLQLLVNTITLRRQKDTIPLVPKEEQIISLEFSKDEQDLHDFFYKDGSSRFKQLTSNRTKLGGRGYQFVLQAIRCMRLSSAHGKELLNDHDMQLLQGMDPSMAIDVDEDRPAITQRQAYEMLSLCQESDSDNCARCSQKLVLRETSADNDGKITLGYMLPCYQLICTDCIDAIQQQIHELLDADNHYACPFCGESGRESFFELTLEGIEQAQAARELARDNPKRAKVMGRYQGPHTKVRALLGHLHQSAEESREDPQKPIKSVVFSCWTTYLDLIAIALDDHGFKYTYLDGRMDRKARQASLAAFREDPGVTVMLVSIAAGGEGVNLNVANKVYIMEPQFNPAREAQAVDRVHRMGQERPVTCVRFIMANSIEVKIQDLQNKKKRLAELSLSGKRLERSGEQLGDLRFLFR